jgi:predicted XRE-type DNA-binding protein
MRPKPASVLSWRSEGARYEAHTFVKVDVFRDLGSDGPEGANLRIRSELMIAVRRMIEDRGLTQEQAAELFGVTQPRVSDVVRGHIDRFTIDALAAGSRTARATSTSCARSCTA